MLTVSVLVPVRDAGPWLRASLASLWRQTWRDFEVVAVNDGSSDDSGEQLEAAARRERRLRVLHTPALGLPAALEAGRAVASGNWIARHDADDLSHRDRLSLQVHHIRQHPDIDVLGTCLRLFPSTGYGIGMRRWRSWHDGLLTHEAMAGERLIDSPLAHATAMIRRVPLERVGGWRELGWAEDLDLWLRLFEGGARFAKLSRVLYSWRQHQRSSTRRDPRYAVARFMDLKKAALDRTLFSGARVATLVGVGSSLLRWRDHLGARVAEVVDLRSPQHAAVTAWNPPVVLVMGAATARSRWRAELSSHGWLEGRDFAFIS